MSIQGSKKNQAKKLFGNFKSHAKKWGDAFDDQQSWQEHYLPFFVFDIVPGGALFLTDTKMRESLRAYPRWGKWMTNPGTCRYWKTKHSLDLMSAIVRQLEEYEGDNGSKKHERETFLQYINNLMPDTEPFKSIEEFVKSFVAFFFLCFKNFFCFFCATKNRMKLELNLIFFLFFFFL